MDVIAQRLDHLAVDLERMRGVVCPRRFLHHLRMVEVAVVEDDEAAGRQLVNGGSPRCIEIWNHVFIQFNANADGTFAPLAAKHVDTGMGFERVAGIHASTNGFKDFTKDPSNYAADVFAPLFSKIAALSAKTYAATVPTKREVRTGDAEKRLFLKWQDGSQDRIKADMELFQRASEDASNGVILHFYPTATEQMLAQLEVSYGNQQPAAIRRTYFRVRKTGSGYEFVVDRQVLK